MAYRTIIAAALAVAASGVQAADFDRVESGRWEIYALKDCWMATQQPDGTSISFSTSSTRGDGRLYIQLANPDWTSLTDDTTQPMRVQFGSVDLSVSGYANGKGEHMDPSVGMFLTGSDDAYLSVLRTGPTVRITTRGTTVAETSLAGSAAAVAHLARCTAVKRRSGDPFTTRGKDPFK